MKTTRELAREESHNLRVQNLQELLVKNYDANKGFKKAMKEAKNPDLKEYLKSQAFRHHRYATQLDKLIHSLNEKPITEGSTVGRFHRIWMDIMIGISDNDDQKILEECLRGQRATMKEYKDKMQNNNFSPEIKEVLKGHLVELEDTLKEIKKLEDIKNF